ncbi:MAG: PilZ domain-containing protein [Desulfobacterales bacterium]|nr:MAG: PilZ domain-containing protein [Desulfobacterales bacterium]
MSSGGVYVETREEFSVGQQITLSFKLPDSADHIIIGGEIVRASSQGIGVKFGISPDNSLKQREEQVKT